MAALVVLGLMGLGLLGYALLQKLNALGKQSKPALYEKPDETEAPLVFFEDEKQCAELTPALDCLFPDRRMLPIPDIPANARPRAVIALLADDADNLLLCTRAMRIRKDCITLACCHEPTLAPLFAQKKITHVLRAPPTNQALLAILQGGTNSCTNNEKA
ncbi:MAG: hypothetical protein RR653_05250 [Clostridia bacterium]